MFGRAGLKFTALGLLGMALMAGPASAVTVVTLNGTENGGLTNTLGGANSIQLSNPDGTAPGETDFQYTFTAEADGIATLTILNGPQILQGTGGQGFPTVSWTPAGITDVPITTTYQTNPAFTVISAALVAGTQYTIDIVGDVVGSVGLNAVLSTPVPPALILFGTALAGLTWLGRRRQGASGVAAA